MPEKNTVTKRKAKQTEIIKISDSASSSTDEEPQCTRKKRKFVVNAKPTAASNSNTAPKARSSFWERRKVWDIHDLLSESENIRPQAALNIVQLFENENTIPFICRYRRDLVDHITPERLCDIKDTYVEIKALRSKAESIVKRLAKEQKISNEVCDELLSAKTSEELELMYAPYKPTSKGSLAERAKALGLEVYANRILFGDSPIVKLSDIVDPKVNDLVNEEKVMAGICDIIEHILSKHTEILEELRRLQKVHRIHLCSTKVKASKLKPNEKSGFKNIKEMNKFETYFDFRGEINNLRPYQILAINRGENLKFLSVKLLIPDQLKSKLLFFTRNLFMSSGIRYELRNNIFERSFEASYTKKIMPFLKRQIRSKLNEQAKKASISVFAKNLRQLLLTSPLKGKPILGLDPGFRNGCKFALISETADVLETGVINPHQSDEYECGEQLVKVLLRHNCKIIALGNGTACRETEMWLTRLFKCGILDATEVQYSIVSEAGASVYSCSEVARKEFPNMDVNQISAVSIARRLNDPLSEYVKIVPKHLGVGMYQHDINEKALTESLNDVVSHCVSYVGVDINTASLSVLKHVAGLSEKKAEKIIEHRAEKGNFRSRKDLLKVKTIGEKTFVQCAGFIRIEPLSIGGKVENILDCTWVHPESYEVATKIIEKCKLQLKDIGRSQFIESIKAYATKDNIKSIAAEFELPSERIEIVIIALQRKLLQDYRADLDKRPLFRQGLTKITELSIGDSVTGAVGNITDFGAFVHIGVECDGLIHVSNMNGMELNLGDRVAATILNIDVQRSRIGLRLNSILNEIKIED